MGLATHLQLPDFVELQLQGWSDEALATAQIEGEILQLNSVRTSAARRLGLSNDKKSNAMRALRPHSMCFRVLWKKVVMR